MFSSLDGYHHRQLGSIGECQRLLHHPDFARVVVPQNGQDRSPHQFWRAGRSDLEKLDRGGSPAAGIYAIRTLKRLVTVFATDISAFAAGRSSVPAQAGIYDRGGWGRSRWGYDRAS